LLLFKADDVLVFTIAASLIWLLTIERLFFLFLCVLFKESIIKEKNQELLSKEEKIRGLELYIREKPYLFESEIDFSQVRFSSIFWSFVKNM